MGQMTVDHSVTDRWVSDRQLTFDFKYTEVTVTFDEEISEERMRNHNKPELLVLATGWHCERQPEPCQLPQGSHAGQSETGQGAGGMGLVADSE